MPPSRGIDELSAKKEKGNHGGLILQTHGFFEGRTPYGAAGKRHRETARLPDLPLSLLASDFMGRVCAPPPLFQGQ